MASRMLVNASSRVRPCEMHPSSVGHSATIQPSSPGRRTTGNLLARSPMSALRLCPRSLGVSSAWSSPGEVKLPHWSNSKHALCSAFQRPQRASSSSGAPARHPEAHDRGAELGDAQDLDVPAVDARSAVAPGAAAADHGGLDAPVSERPADERLRVLLRSATGPAERGGAGRESGNETMSTSSRSTLRAPQPRARADPHPLEASPQARRGACFRDRSRPPSTGRRSRRVGASFRRRCRRPSCHRPCAAR